VRVAARRTEDADLRGAIPMTTTTFDRAAYRDQLRREWRDAASGWRRWFPTLEANAAMRQVSRPLLVEADLRPGHRVLDVATGYGEPGLTVAQIVAPGGLVLLQDLSGEMLAFARDRAQWTDLRDVDVAYLEGDVEELDIEDLPLDTIVSRSALMYLTDPGGTLARLRSFLVPGGRLAASVWGPPSEVAFAAPVPLIREMVGSPDPDPEAPGLFALADDDRLASVVRDAGFEDLRLGRTTATFVFDSPAEATRFLRDCAPPITALVDGAPAEAREQVWARVTDEVWQPFTAEDGRVHLPNEARWISATNPG
jgi:enediyne biosynthesis protein CalE5